MAADAPGIYLYLVAPDGTPTSGGTVGGFVLSMAGYHEKQMSDPFFNSKGNRKYKHFVDTLDCVKHIYKMTIDGVEQKWPVSTYSKRVLVFILEDPDQCTEQFVRGYVNDVFLPAFKILTRVNPLPSIVHFETVQVWTDLFDLNSVLHFLDRKYTFPSNAPFATLTEFFQEHIGRVYSIYCQGQVSRELINEVDLGANHVLPEDRDKVPDPNSPEDPPSAKRPSPFAIKSTIKRPRVNSNDKPVSHVAPTNLFGESSSSGNSSLAETSPAGMSSSIVTASVDNSLAIPQELNHDDENSRKPAASD